MNTKEGNERCGLTNLTRMSEFNYPGHFGAYWNDGIVERLFSRLKSEW